MDLGAYILIDELKELLPSEPPRLRGIRLMRFEEPIDNVLFDSFCGKDVIYIHTRCGQCHFDGDDNYEAFGMDTWETKLGDLFLDAENDEFDCTYRDTYIVVPEDKLELYRAICSKVE